jgi:hypothetical protein
LAEEVKRFSLPTAVIVVELLEEHFEIVEWMQDRVGELRRLDEIKAQKERAAVDMRARLAEYAAAQPDPAEAARLAQEYADAQEPQPLIQAEGPIGFIYGVIEGALCAPTYRCVTWKVEDGGSGSNGRQ